MKRTLAILVLVGFLIYTGVFVFVYLFRAFRLPEPAAETTVYLWHGDPMARAILVAVLFGIGLTLLTFVVQTRPGARRAGAVRLRADLLQWLADRAEQTNEDPSRVAERAVAYYRTSLEEGIRPDR